MSQSISLFLAAVTVVGSSIACDWEETLAHIIEHQETDSPYTALSELDQLIAQCPSTARLYLEKGTLLYKLQRYQDASDQWQYAISNYELPENVALKVKLKILEAQKKKQKQLQHYLIARAGWQTQSNEEQQYASVSLQGKSTYHFPAINVLNLPAYSEVFTGYGGLFRQPLASEGSTSNTDTLLMFQFGGAVNWQNWNLPLTLGWNIIDNESLLSLSTTPRYKWHTADIAATFEYDITDETFEIEPETHWKWAGYAFATSAVFQKDWQSLSAEVSTGKRWKFKISGEADLVMENHEVGAEVSTRLTPELKLSFNSDVVLADPSYWNAKAGLVWKLY